MDDIQKVDTVIKTLGSKKWVRPSPIFDTAVQWLTYFPPNLGERRKRSLLAAVCSSFEVSEQELYAIIANSKLPDHQADVRASEEEALEAALPKEGWLHDYANFTRFVECPLSYSLFSSLCVLGCGLGRRVWRDKQHFRIWPTINVILVGPPGRVRKTTAIEIARGIIRKQQLCPCGVDKVTPEALVMALIEDPRQFIGAGELSFLFGKQRYNEGLVTLILKLLDYPSELRIRTVSREEETIDQPTVHMLGGSTVSLLVRSSADQVASSGFLSRFLVVHEDDTSRCYPHPAKGPYASENRLLASLDWIKEAKGEVTLEKEANEWYEEWYRQRWREMKEVQDETSAQLLERGPVHLERMAMVIHLADCKTRQVCLRCMQAAETLLSYSERQVPRMAAALNQTNRAQDSETVLNQLRRLGGAADHSKLLRAVSGYGIDATSFKRSIATLEEQKVVRTEKKGGLHFYILEEQ